jgi:hypothetical protein
VLLKEAVMAVLGHLLCRTCKERTCLGKWLRYESDVGFGFWRGGLTDEQLGLKTLNFLARHVDHDILLLSDGEYDRRSWAEPFHEYFSIEDELRDDWPRDARPA